MEGVGEERSKGTKRTGKELLKGGDVGERDKRESNEILLSSLAHCNLKNAIFLINLFEMAIVPDFLKVYDRERHFEGG